MARSTHLVRLTLDMWRRPCIGDEAKFYGSLRELSLAWTLNIDSEVLQAMAESLKSSPIEMLDLSRSSFAPHVESDSDHQEPMERNPNILRIAYQTFAEVLVHVHESCHLQTVELDGLCVELNDADAKRFTNLIRCDQNAIN